MATTDSTRRPVERSTRIGRGNRIRGAKLDVLYQHAVDVQDAACLVDKAVATSDALLFLLNRGEPGGEVETLMAEHFQTTDRQSPEQQDEAQIAAEAVSFYRQLSNSEKRVMLMLFANLQHMGAGVTLGMRGRHCYVDVVDTVDRTQKAS